jgi:SPP1 family phage portal protein
MFLLGKDTELTPTLLRKVLDKFNTTDLPKRQKFKNQYDGKHAILSKTKSDPSKPCNRIVTNFCKVVTDTYTGYIAGKPVTYTSNDDITDVQEVINYNDDESANISWLRNALIHGVGYELQWLDKDAQVRYSQIDPLTCFAIHSASLDKELLYFVRWYDICDFDDSDLKHIEVYDANKKTVYKCNGISGALEFVEEAAHNFGDVPVSVFYLDEDEEAIFAQAITLNDSYNELQSSEVDSFQEWADCYLKIKGMDADDDTLKAMKEGRTLIMPADADADWLTKNVSDTQIENMLEGTRKDIFKVTSAPDMGDENFMAQSGEAIKYKLVMFENRSSGIVTCFTKAIQRRIELICNILKLKASDAVWRDININFVRNLPVNLTEIAATIGSFKGMVSDATLLAQVPFVTDVESELEALKKQKEENMNLYGGAFMDTHTDEDEDTEEDDV